jgi:hypothetical protein
VQPISEKPRRSGDLTLWQFSSTVAVVLVTMGESDDLRLSEFYKSVWSLFLNLIPPTSLTSCNLGIGIMSQRQPQRNHSQTSRKERLDQSLFSLPTSSLLLCHNWAWLTPRPVSNTANFVRMDGDPQTAGLRFVLFLSLSILVRPGDGFNHEKAPSYYVRPTVRVELRMHQG